MHVPGWLVADGILAGLFGVDKSRYDWEVHQHHHELAEVSYVHFNDLLP